MNKEFDYPKENAQHEAGLSYQEKSLIASVIGSLIIYVIYGWQVYQRFQAGGFDPAEEFRFWGRAFLLLILIQVVFEVVMQIAMVIAIAIATNEEEDPSFLDERDKLIDLKGSRYQFVIMGIWFLLAMGALAVGRPPTVMFVLLMISMMTAGIVGSLAKLYLYRRGV